MTEKVKRDIIVVGPNCWGRAPSVKAAKTKARVNYSPTYNGPIGKAKFIGFCVPVTASVDEISGGICSRLADGEVFELGEV